jgi:hypothetical protein
MPILQPVWNPFSKYADKFEKKINKLLGRLDYAGKFGVENQLLELMQTNLVITNLWLEFKFKGYKYLKKHVRKKLYQNSQRIVQTFEGYLQKIEIPEAVLIKKLELLDFTVTKLDLPKIKYLAQIMAFLKPGGSYEYLEGASFGKLLKDPEKEKLIGDCNQICTLYVFLYSLRFPVTDLQIKLPQNHICLNFKGVDIEATNGTFQNYLGDKQVFPIIELISTNLLDVSDFRDKQIKVDPREFLKAAKLAAFISSNRELVQKNLKAAYHNVAVDALRNDDFQTAEFFFGKTGDFKALESVYHNAVIYYVNKYNFSRAKYYLSKNNQPELQKYVKEKEGYYYFDRGQTARARQIFAEMGNQQMVKACYAREYNQLQKQVAGLKTIEQLKRYKSVYQKMLELGRKMEDQQIVEQLQKLLKQL